MAPADGDPLDVDPKVEAEAGAGGMPLDCIVLLLIGEAMLEEKLAGISVTEESEDIVDMLDKVCDIVEVAPVGTMLTVMVDPVSMELKVVVVLLPIIVVFAVALILL